MPDWRDVRTRCGGAGVKGISLEGAIGSSPMARGKEFTDRLFASRARAPSGEHEFEQLCAEFGIEHRLTPPKSPADQRHGRAFQRRIEEVLQSHHFHSGEELENTLHRYVLLYNQQLPQSALGSNTPLQTMKACCKLKPEMFKKQPYCLTGCGAYANFWTRRREI